MGRTQPGPEGGSRRAQGQQLTWTRPGRPGRPGKNRQSQQQTGWAHLEPGAGLPSQAHTPPLWLPFQGRARPRETKGAWPQNTEPVFLPLRENHTPARLCGRSPRGLKELLCSGRHWRGPRPRGGQCRGRQGCSQDVLKKKPFFQARPQPSHWTTRPHSWA